MTSAVIDDIASLALVAILVPIASGQGSFSITGMALLAGKAISFFLIVTALGAWIFPNEPGKWVERLPWLSGWGIRQVLAFGGGAQATLSVLLLALLVGLAAHALGFHPAVGAYMAGLILKEEYFGGDAEQGSFHAVKRIVDNVAFSWIGPVFFVVLGARIVFDWDVFVAVIPETLVMIAALFTAQILSAGLAARFTGAMDWAGSWMIGFGMLGRAELAFVVLDIAYVQNQILSQEAFYTLMFTAFALNIAVPVTISLWKPVYTRSLSAA